MQENNDSPGRLANPQSERQVGVRGCWELILKLIIALIVIAAFIINWLRNRQLDLFTLIVLLILIALLIWLILRQRHFVFLNCGLTNPTGCVHGNHQLLSGRVLEPIIGTAGGLGFANYELEVLWNGTTSIPAAVIYADHAGNPDTSLTAGNHQVSNGSLGFVDLQQAAMGAGAGISTSTDFEVRLHVVGIDGSRRTCTITFSVTAARAYIKSIGGAWAHDVTNVDEILRAADVGAGDELTVGGSISVRGAATAYGCDAEQIKEYHVWAIPDPDPAHAVMQPPNNSPITVLGTWLPVATVIYSTIDQRNFNTLDGMPDPDFLTNIGWFTRQICTWVDLIPIPICHDVPDLHEFYWPSGPSGKYAFLLQVIDTAGNIYYDIQRAWIDNETIRGKIEGPVGVNPCEDIYILDIPGGILALEGFATDPLTVAGDTTRPTSDNFSEYKVGFRKQGAASDVWLDIPLIGGSHPGLGSTLPVPDRATWSGGAGDPPIAVFAEWDLRWLDAATNPHGLPPDQLLAQNESCPYDIILEVSDKTLVSESGHHSTGRLTFPVKIHNAHAPMPSP